MLRSPLAGSRASSLPRGFAGTLYIDFLARLCALRGVKRYFEIGVHFGHTLAAVSCDTAVGVDPSYILDANVMRGKRRAFLFQDTSDRFFAETDLRQVLGGLVELAFLDGLHQFEFLLRDFANTERACGPNSLIVMHDCMPLTAEMTARDSAGPRSDPEPYSKMWTGDVWKIVPILRRYRPDLEVHLVDCAPTGLVCVTGLDPASTVLADSYLDIVRAFGGVPSTEAEIAAMYAANAIVPSAAILNGQDQGLFFRT